MTIKVLLIDDNANFCNQAKIYFKSRMNVQYNIIVETDGRKAEDVFNRERPDVVLLDVDLNLKEDGVNGFVICSQLSKTPQYSTRQFAIIMISAVYISTTDQIQGIELGAHDYLYKPIELPLLHTKIQRIYALLAIEHGGVPLNDPINIGKRLTIHVRQRCVFVDNKKVELTKREFDVLAYLAQSPGDIHTRADLLEYVWKDDPGNFSSGVVDKTMLNIRKKLACFSTKALSNEEKRQFDLVHDDFIVTKYGVGFTLRMDG